MSELLQLLVNGMVAGSVLALAAVGVTLVYGVLRVVNFAHGDYLTIGAYVALTAATSWHVNMAVGTVAAVVVTAVVAVLLEFVIWRPLRRRGAGTLTLFLAAIGLALILRQALLLVFGSDAQQFPVDAFTTINLGPVRLSTVALVALTLALIGNVAVGLFLTFTRLGKSLRAYRDNPLLAEVSGINTNRLIILGWAIAGGLAGLAGVSQGLVQASFDPNMGWSLLLPIFAAVTLGTIGNAYGALVGGFVLGLVMNLSTWSALGGGLPAAYQQLIAFVVLVLVLILKPEGLFTGKRS